MVLWEIQHQEMPYEGLTSEEISEKILKGEYPSQSSAQGTPIEFQRVIERAWAQDPKDRDNMKNLFESLDKLDATYLMQRAGFNNYQSIELKECLDLDSKTTINKLDHEKGPEILEGIKYHENKRYKTAWKIFKDYESKSDDADGKYWVGYYYLKGWHKGAKRAPNPRASVSYLKFAAESGHADAQYYYALTVMNRGMAAKEHRNKDRTKIAIDYLKSSAKQDQPDALKTLGWIISKGQCTRYGINKDIMTGRAMIEKSRDIRKSRKPEKSFALILERCGI